jgi:hypothetical protein
MGKAFSLGTGGWVAGCVGLILVLLCGLLLLLPNNQRCPPAKTYIPQPFAPGRSCAPGALFQPTPVPPRGCDMSGVGSVRSGSPGRSSFGGGGK